MILGKVQLDVLKRRNIYLESLGSQTLRKMKKDHTLDLFSGEKFYSRSTMLLLK